MFKKHAKIQILFVLRKYNSAKKPDEFSLHQAFLMII